MQYNPTAYRNWNAMGSKLLFFLEHRSSRTGYLTTQDTYKQIWRITTSSLKCSRLPVPSRKGEPLQRDLISGLRNISHFFLKNLTFSPRHHIRLRSCLSVLPNGLLLWNFFKIFKGIIILFFSLHGILYQWWNINMHTKIREDPFVVYSEWFSWLMKNTSDTETKENEC